MRPLGIALAVGVCGVGAALGQSAAAGKAPVGLALQIADYAALPMTGSPNGTGNNDGSLARINFMREEPAPPHRFFVNDLSGPLYILNRTTKNATIYLDFNGTGVMRGLFRRLARGSGLASGFISFEFDPDYARNGRFYTIHLEDLTATGGLAPDNAGFLGLQVNGYSPTPPVRTPPTADHEGVLIEWTDSNTSNATFEGSARELLRVQLFSRIHPLGDLTFNPAARPGDPDLAGALCGVRRWWIRRSAIERSPQSAAPRHARRKGAANSSGSERACRYEHGERERPLSHPS